MNQKNKNIILHCSLIDGIGPKTIARLTNDYTDIQTDFYTLRVNDIMTRGIAKEKAEVLVKGLQNNKLLDDELLLMAKERAFMITPYDNEYPAGLKQQDVYPSVLYQQQASDIFDINKYISLAVVSSRQTNEYGKRVIDSLFRELADKNIVIVSGGAIGGDTFIHQAALKYNIKTIAIIGAGLSQWYPKQNKVLFESIVKNGGAMMSHFSLGTLASSMTFPIRNSVIAGIAQAVLVIQAGEKSGTLITAQYGLDYGKEVGAVPGYIDDRIMIESNNLIKQGAHCITCGKDVLSMLNIESVSGSNVLSEDKAIKYNDCSLQQKNILQLCVEPISLYQLSAKLHIEIDFLYAELFVLLEKKYLKQDVMGNWIKIY